MVSMQPLGDQAVLARCADESGALRLAGAVRRAAPAWLVDVVPAYASMAVFFDPQQIHYADAADFLRATALSAQAETPVEGKLHLIPCCYEFQLDLDGVARHCGMSADKVVRLHLDSTYTVYAIGFCPGFPYLGYLPPALSGVPRLASPRLRVEAGSVGVAGRQTGIYTEVRPGGWNLIGRTPLALVDVAAGFFPLQTGDRVRFVRIDDKEFHRLLGQRL